MDKGMETKFQICQPDQWQADVIIALCCEDENPATQYPELDKACPWLTVAPALRDFSGKKGQSAFIYGHPDLHLPRALLVGLGKRSEAVMDDIRDGMGLASQRCRDLGLTSALIPVSMLSDLPGGKSRLVTECVYSFWLGLYRFAEYKKPDSQPEPAWLAIGMTSHDELLESAAKKGEMDAWAVYTARDLDNQPGNHLFPETIALRAVDMAHKYGFECTVHDQSSLSSLGAGCLLAVGQGSSHPPRLVVMEYKHPAHESDKPLVFVGKGISFDSGGLCIKPPTNMWQMKCDMSGAGAVLAVMATAAREQVQARIIGILACAENMPDGNAYRPGDILSALNGESVEVINTDAEGRLALADALSFAGKNFSPRYLIDIATLTGACAVALGNGLAGLFCNKDEFAQRISAIGSAAGENFWRMPLWEPYKDSLKSEVADIKHTASREGGAITAALFLQNFIPQDTIWAHMDIAGVDWSSKSTHLCTEGATGFGTRTLLEIARGNLA